MEKDLYYPSKIFKIEIKRILVIEPKILWIGLVNYPIKNDLNVYLRNYYYHIIQSLGVMYILSISPSYFFKTTFLFNFNVGVNYPLSTLKSTGSK